MLKIRRRCRREHGGRKTFCFDVVGNVSKKHCGNRNVGRCTYDGSTYDSAPCLQKTYHRDFQDPTTRTGQDVESPTRVTTCPFRTAYLSHSRPSKLSRSNKIIGESPIPQVSFFGGIPMCGVFPRDLPTNATASFGNYLGSN